MRLFSISGVLIFTTNEIVLAEHGRFPLQIHSRQQILRYYRRRIAVGPDFVLRTLNTNTKS